MSKNLSELPFTEIVEKVSSISRTPENSKGKIRGIINDVYARELPYKWDWNFLLASSSIITQEEYKTGTVTINTGSTSIVFSSDASLDATFTGRQIKISGNDVVYDFTYSNATGGTISPSFQGLTNASGNSFTIFQGEYALASNFDRFPKDGGIYNWSGGQKEILPEESFQEDARFFVGSPTTPEKIRLIESDTLGRQMIRFRPAPNKAKVYGYDYIKKITPLSDNTQGTVTISASGTAVTGSTSCKFTDSSVGDYLRVDNFGTGDDSSWYRIVAISHDSSLTLQTAFASTGVTAANFTASKAPDMPIRMHSVILWGALRQITVDQNDQNSAFYIAKNMEALQDAKKLYVTRVYSQKVSTVAEEFMYRR